MASYDIVHVEDDPRCFKYVEQWAQKSGLTYINFQALDELAGALPEISARFWVVDGRFPETRGDVIENNSARAVEAIRIHHPNARIGLYSAEMDVRNHSQKIGVEHFDKSRFTAGKLVDRIKEILGE